MIGNQENPGIMQQTMSDLFKGIENEKKFKDFVVKASYLEIYNETIQDLISEDKINIDLREDPLNGVVISGTIEKIIQNSSEIMKLLKMGNKNRTKESTGANEFSSRSHAILQVLFKIFDKLFKFIF